jgi:hypothetical protein
MNDRFVNELDEITRAIYREGSGKRQTCSELAGVVIKELAEISEYMEKNSGWMQPLTEAMDADPNVIRLECKDE